MSNEYLTLTTELPLFAVGDITLYMNRNGWTAKLDMQPDITTRELSQLMVLLFTAYATAGGQYDYERNR